MEYTITYKKPFMDKLKKIQCENIHSAITLAEELVSLGYTIHRITRNI